MVTKVTKGMLCRYVAAASVNIFSFYISSYVASLLTSQNVQFSGRIVIFAEIVQFLSV